MPYAYSFNFTGWKKDKQLQTFTQGLWGIDDVQAGNVIAENPTYLLYIFFTYIPVYPGK